MEEPRVEQEEEVAGHAVPYQRVIVVGCGPPVIGHPSLLGDPHCDEDAQHAVDVFGAEPSGGGAIV